MPEILSDVKDFQFKGRYLMGRVISWNDVLLERVATHEYLKRDGAEQEPMGSKPAQFSMRICYLGEGWARAYRLLVADIRKDPRGLLVHPILGEFQVVCTGISSAEVNPAQAIDTIEFTIGFLEDALDQTIAADAQQTPAAKATEADDFAAALEIATSALEKVTTTDGPPVSSSVSIDIAAATDDMVTASRSYTSAALAASINTTPDLTLTQKLADVVAATQDLLDELIADTSRHDASKYEAISTAEETLSACLELDEIVAAQQPLIITYTVPQKTALTTLAALFYGRDAQAHLDEIRLLNRIPNPAAIPGGTSLRMVAPTV
jgi:hypothetical protein